jgi:D-glycero-alpha-D-manno-heptose-7-phosphate kinase
MEVYQDERVIVNPLRIKSHIVSELESSLVLYYTGASRDSASIIDDQIANMCRQDSQALTGLKELVSEAFEMKEILLKGDIHTFAELLGRGWESKKRTASKITNPHIDHLYDTARQAGAHSGKISGAGGGGFIMFIVDPVRRMQVLEALQAEPGMLVSCHFVDHGVHSWRV